MKPWLRHHRYALCVALRRLALQPFSSLANVLVIALSLTLPLMGAVALSALQPALGQLSIDPQLTLFLAHDASAAQRAQLVRRLQTGHEAQIAAVHVVPREQALEQFRHAPGWSEALAALPDNPLPDAIVVTLRASADVPARADALAQQWRQWENVDHVQFDSDWMQRLHAMVQALRIALGLLGTSVGLVVLATTFNTVRMQALGQREEIAVARLVGATESFVRRPFLYLGALSGLAAGVLAIAATAAALAPLNVVLGRLAASYGVAFALRLPSVQTLLPAVFLVAVLCAVAARWAVTRTAHT